MALIFVDCEDVDAVNGGLREFGAVEYKTRQIFHGHDDSIETFVAFREWLAQFRGRPIFVSDNPAYDWQGINHCFLKYFGKNPFGHSARRISDFYAGVVGNFYETQAWKAFRKTPHDHNPVHDALGNAEAFEEICALVKARADLG